MIKNDGEDDARFATCIKCAYSMPWFQSEQMITAMPCPQCEAANQFGPGVYVHEFNGYTLSEVMNWKASKAKVKQ